MREMFWSPRHVSTMANWPPSANAVLECDPCKVWLTRPKVYRSVTGKRFVPTYTNILGALIQMAYEGYYANYIRIAYLALYTDEKTFHDLVEKRYGARLTGMALIQTLCEQEGLSEKRFERAIARLAQSSEFHKVPKPSKYPEDPFEEFSTISESDD